MSIADLVVVMVLWAGTILLGAIWTEKILRLLREIRDELRK